MAEIRPFHGLRYNTNKVKPEEVITLPYDKINPSLQGEYYSRSPYNLVRILLGKEEPKDSGTTNKYSRAREFLDAWQKESVFIPENEDAIYLYDQHYTVPGTDIKRVRRSFIALAKLEDFETGKVRPHERTLSGPKADRIKLLNATEAHFGLICMLYDDPENKINQALEAVVSETPLFDFVDDQQVRNILWGVTQPGIIFTVQNAMKEKTLFIADGHHRYETALAIKKKKSKQPDAARYECAMMAFVNLAQEGLTVLPTHRIVKNRPDLNKFEFLTKCEHDFDVQAVDSIETLFKELESQSLKHVIGAYFSDQSFYSLSLKGEKGIEALTQAGISSQVARLDVTLLHKLILEKNLDLSVKEITSGQALGYCRDKNKAVQEVDGKRAQVAFFLNPTKPNEVKEVCLAGEVLPQKSTDFYPKLLSGMVIHKL